MPLSWAKVKNVQLAALDPEKMTEVYTNVRSEAESTSAYWGMKLSLRDPVTPVRATFFIILPVWWSTLLHYWIKTTMLSTSNQKWVPRLNSKQEPNTKRTRQQHFWRNQSSAFSLVEIPCFGTGQQLQQCFGWYVTTVLWVWRNALLRWSTVENVSSAFIWSYI